MNPGARTFHRSLALWVAIPLSVTLATGLVYRIGRSWFGMEKPTGNFILSIHSGEWMGQWGSGLYILVAGLGLLAMAASGLKMLLSTKTKNTQRFIHRILGLTLLLPLLVSAFTGIGFHFGSTALPFSEPTLKFLMFLHQGSWMGPHLRPLYVLFVGLGLLFVLVSGLRLHKLNHR